MKRISNSIQARKVYEVNNHIVSKIQEVYDKDLLSILPNILNYNSKTVEKILNGEKELTVNDLAIICRHFAMDYDDLYKDYSSKIKV